MKLNSLMVLVWAGLITGSAQATAPSQAPASIAGPTIMNVNPKIAPAGTQVTLMGSKLMNVKRVLFDDIEAKFTVISDKEVRAIVPLGAKSGEIQIVSSDGAYRTKDIFQVDNTQH
jgi:hypothetical protein